MKILKILFALGVTGHLYAQTGAEITGRITDASKAVVPGASVTAVNTDKRTERTTTSSDQGYYVLPSLDPGNYEIAVRTAGFKPVTQSGIKLDVNQSVRLDFALDVGQMSEKIEVTAEMTLLEANTAQLVSWVRSSAP